VRRVTRRLLAAGAALGVAAVTASSAGAAAPTGPYRNFAQCPTSVPNLSSCVYSKSKGGSFTLGNTRVPIAKHIIFQGGYVADPNTGDETFYGAADGDTLSPTALKVPGGLVGLAPPDLFPQPLQGILKAAIRSFNGVTATAELVGPPQFSFTNFANVAGPAVTLPVQIQLSNPFLGGDCYIGSASDPVTLNLTDGTTSPPAGVTPLTGTSGKLTFRDGGNLIVATGDELVDNTFAVPGASGCGGVFSGLIDPVLNLKTGIPAAAGVSSAILKGKAEVAAASAVIASEQ
jgi:hypothetical protein